MRIRFRRAAVPTAPQRLDVYDIAYLAGGPQRVADTALAALSERGGLTVLGPRVRAEEQLAVHAVEETLLALCPRSRSLAKVFVALLGEPVVEEIGRRLVSFGLLGRSRERLTSAGRRSLAAAREEKRFPDMSSRGPAAVEDRALRRAIREAWPGPSGLSGRLIDLGRAVDDYDDGLDAYGDAGFGSGGGGGHFSCGGGSSGGSD